MLERIYLEIGNICNLSCSFCAGTSRPKRQMTEEEFSLICEKIKAHTKFIYLHVMGEPLLHPKLDSFLRTANLHSLSVCITTNGTLLKERGCIILENANAIHKISISLHAPEGNAISNHTAYLNDVTNFGKIAADLGIYVVYRLWNEDSCEGKGQNSNNTAIEEFLRKRYQSDWQNRPKGYRLAKNTFLEYDGIFTWPSESTAEEQLEGFCHALSNQAAILVDGTVVPCCLDSEGRLPLGNIYTSNFEEILSGEVALRIKKGFAAGKMVAPLCQKCTFARRFKKR